MVTPRCCVGVHRAMGHPRGLLWVLRDTGHPKVPHWAAEKHG